MPETSHMIPTSFTLPDSPLSKPVARAGWSRIVRLFFITLLGTLLLAGCQSADDETPDTTTPGSNGGGDNQTDPPPAPDTGASFSLQADATSYSMVEGDSISVPLTLTRDDNHELPVTLSLAAGNGNDAQNLAFSFADTQLTGSESDTTLTLRLDISVAPIMPQQRSITITASDSGAQSTLTLDLDISPVAVPDVYLLVGQSNMEGFSETDTKDAGPGGLDEPDARIRQLNATGNDNGNFSRANDFSNPQRNVAFPRFVTAQDPLHESFNPSTDTKEGTRIGLGLSFAKAALPNTTQDIILVPAAWAGTGFCDFGFRALAWNPVAIPEDPTQGGTQLFDRALTRVNIALEETGGILRGILWHQGETDSIADCSGKYASNLQAMISAFRTRIQPDPRGSAARGTDAPVPFILGSMSRGDDERGEFSVFDDPKTEVDSVHRSITSLVNLSGLSNHDDLVPAAYPCGQGSCIHFGASALREMGRRYYETLQGITLQ